MSPECKLMALIQISQSCHPPLQEQETEAHRTVTHPGSMCTGGRASSNPSSSPGYCLAWGQQTSSTRKAWAGKSARATSCLSNPAPSLSTRTVWGLPILDADPQRHSPIFRGS